MGRMQEIIDAEYARIEGLGDRRYREAQVKRGPIPATPTIDAIPVADITPPMPPPVKHPHCLKCGKIFAYKPSAAGMLLSKHMKKEHPDAS